MKKRSSGTISLVIVVAALAGAALASTANASTGFEAEYKDSSHSTQLAAATMTMVITLNQGQLGCQVPFSTTTDIPASVVISSQGADPKCGSSSLQMNGCRFTLSPEGTFGIGPPSCGPVNLHTCSIQPQNGLIAKYTNQGTGSNRSVNVQLQGINVKHSCGGKEYESGSIAGQWDVKAIRPSGVAEGIWVSNELSVPRFCKMSGEKCAASDLYPAETWLDANSTDARISAPLFGVEVDVYKCTESSIETLSVFASSWLLSDCDWGGSTCNTASTSANFLSSLGKGEGSNGTLTLWSGGSGLPRWHFECGEYGQVNCVYTLSPAPTLDVTAGSPASLNASKEAVTGSGTSCLKLAKFSATYSINTPNPLYVVNG